MSELLLGIDLRVSKEERAFCRKALHLQQPCPSAGSGTDPAPWALGGQRPGWGMLSRDAAAGPERLMVRAERSSRWVWCAPWAWPHEDELDFPAADASLESAAWSIPPDCFQVMKTSNLLQ